MLSEHALEPAPPTLAVREWASKLASGVEDWSCDLNVCALSALSSESRWDHRDLDYMHRRHHSPLTGRFLSTDPALQVRRAQRSPRFWNRYSYVAGNPLKYVDPTGRIGVLTGSAEEQARTLTSLRNTVAANLRMFIRTTKDAQGRTILDQQFLKMGRSAAGAAGSMNFDSVSKVGLSEKVFEISTSAKSVTTADGTKVDFGSADDGMFLDQGGASPKSDASLVLVGAGDSAQQTAMTLAHEMRHASLFAQGLDFMHEAAMEVISESPDGIAVRSVGPISDSTRAAEAEALVNFDPFYPHE